MKEHLNVNTISKPTGWIDAQNAPDPRNNRTASESAAREDILLPPADDLFNSEMGAVDGFDESSIEGMDFNAAMESVNFIRQQAQTAEGRQMMGRAHREITPQKVMQLFGMEQRA
jgi:hypothetical protein